jgi:glycosyltransferase 2 family protein
MNRRPWLIRGAKLLLVGIVAVGVYRTFSVALADLSARGWRPDSLRLEWLALAGVCYLVGLVPCIWFWRRLLATLGEPVGWWNLARAYFVGHLGKYVPGKAVVLVLRVALLRPTRISPTLVTASVFHETLSTMAVGAAVACAILLATPRETGWLAALAAVLSVASGAPTLPRVFLRLARLLGAARLDQEAANRLAHIPLGRVAVGWPVLALGWVLLGASLWCVVRADPASVAPTAIDLLLCTATAALAVVAGFVALVPGGFVVREAVILGTLAPRFGEAQALVAAIVVRLVWLVAELLVSAILYPRGAPLTDRKPIPPA